MAKSKFVIATYLVLASGAALAGEPVAIVEEVAGAGTGIAVFDYLEEGQVINLSPGGRMIIGYLQSCQREVITGGQIVVGGGASVVKGGKVVRQRVECDGGALKLTKEQAGKSAVTVFRKAPRPSGISRMPKPQLTIYGASPIINLIRPAETVVFERVDKRAGAVNVRVDGSFTDLAAINKSLTPGALYRVTSGGRQIIVKVDPFAEAGAGPIIARLIRF